MTPDQIQSLFAIAVGFALAGVLANGYQAATQQPASFRLLHQGPTASALAAVPFLTFAAPFIIMRNIIRAQGIEDRRFQVAMLATIISAFWSMMSGTVVLAAFVQLQH
jgi:hypothetical protein